MIENPQAPTEVRDVDEIAGEIAARHPGYVPDWTPADKSAGNGLARIFARFLQVVAQRLAQAPEKNRLAFFDVLGLELVPAQSARAPVAFTITPGAPDSQAPAATQVSAPPPPGSSDQIVFETEQAVEVLSASLAQVVSLWPGRDEYLDHSLALAAHARTAFFDHLQLGPTPHVIYLAHDTMLALTGSVEVAVEFELEQTSGGPLPIRWEYWDGQVWRGFIGMTPACAGIAEPIRDSTIGLTRSGIIRLHADCTTAAQVSVNGIKAFWIRGVLTETLPPDPATVLPQVDRIRLSSLIEQHLDDDDPKSGLLPDNALAGTAKLDLTKAFFPFDRQPQPGEAFYFSSEEIFSKPGAHVTVALFKSKTPLEEVTASSTTALDHEVAWEYWNGTEWVDLAVGSGTTDPVDLSQSGVVRFDVPRDMVKTSVNNVNGYWARVRLLRGGYGVTATVTFTSPNPNGQPATIVNTFSYVIIQPPALAAFRMGYSWSKGPSFAEHVVTSNDFQYQDYTDNAQWPGNAFAPFEPVVDITPAVYFGFDKPLPVADLGFYFDFAEQQGDEQGPALIWEYWNGAWVAVGVDDGTQRFRVPGIVSFIGSDDSQTLARFGSSYYWVRARLKEDGPPGEPILKAIYLNAVWASQQRTINDAPLGASSGLPSQVLLFPQVPVLDGERVEVRELGGPRAAVEWRILAAEIAAGDPSAVPTLQQQLAAEGAQTDFVYRDIRLRRDRTKKVTEVWIRWSSQRNFYGSGPDSRDYVLDRATGRLYFGDGIKGRVPSAGSLVVAKKFRTGGGSAGNLSVNTITQLLGAVSGVQRVTNLRAAEGGSDGEALDSYRQRAPLTLRARGRAITASDYETLAREASSAVAVAHAIAGQDINGLTRPGWVTLTILPRSHDPQPTPSFGLRDEVRKYIENRAPADVSGLHQLYVSAPDYQSIDVAATVTPIDPSLAADVETAAAAALAVFLHPLYGGPQGRGWPPGRSVYLSDAAAALRAIEGLDYVEELALYRDGVLQADRVTVGPTRIVAAGQIRINVRAAVS
jgi:uncharacterized phage protein gp47/JayE